MDAPPDASSFGACRYPTPGDGPPSRAPGPFRSGWRRDGAGRGHRDHAVAPLRHAQYGDGSRTFGSTSRSLPVSATLRRLYIVRDDDRAGDGAVPGLFDRAQSARIEAMVLSPQCEDFNEDLRNFDISALRAALRIQLTLEDVGRFLITGI